MVEMIEGHKVISNDNGYFNFEILSAIFVQYAKLKI